MKRDFLKLPEITTAIILAGGKGTRMINFSALPRSLNEQGFHPGKMHKSMIPIGEKPLLEHIILWLKNEKIKKIVIGVGARKESIINYFKDGKKWNIKIIYTEHNPNGGTGDALKEDIDKSEINDDYFFVMNGDQLTSLSLKKLIKIHFSTLNALPLATIALVYPTSPYGQVEKAPKNDKIINFKEKPILKIPTNGGVYLFCKDIYPYLKNDLETHTFPILVKQRKIKGYLYKGFWETINTIKDWERVNNKFQKYVKS
jgi:mannose-1-phosphate guanylyltransferase